MSDSLQYYSTNHNSPTLSFGDALLKGLAPDKGLYLPESIPTLTQEEIAGFSDMPYYEIACTVFHKFFKNDIPKDELLAMCKDAYDFEVPLENVYDRKYVMRLDQGPTASFKDFAGLMMGRLMQYFLKKNNESKLILTATSGDTGSAVANAFYNLSNINVTILFPENEVTPRQRKQMTTLHKNICVLAIDGKFDDAQAMVKDAFSDSDLDILSLTSANSINIGRLIPQIVYYIYSYAKLRKKGVDEKAIFCIPSGNFGDMMGCVFAKKMGLPIEKILVATNSNNEFEVLLNTKKYAKIEPSVNCLSSAMNVGHPSNLARLIELYDGNMDEQGNIHKEPNYTALLNDFFAQSVSDEDTHKAISDAWNQHKLLLEPHGAVGWKCVNDYIHNNSVDTDQLIISLETAHPAKFPESVIKNIGIDPELPVSLQGLDSKEESFETIKGDYPTFKKFLLQKYK